MHLKMCIWDSTDFWETEECLVTHCYQVDDYGAVPLFVE